MSSTYTVTRDQIITKALRILGVVELGDTPDTATLDNASMSLNLIIKMMSTEGLKLWKVIELLVPLVQNKNAYVLGGASSVVMYDSLDTTTPITDKPLKIVQAFYRNTQVTPNIDIPLLVLSQQEYVVLGSKYSTGTANSVYLDVNRLESILLVYLTPDLNASTNTELHLMTQMPLNDITSASDIPDFPNEWMNCLVWNLADQLAMEYGVPMNHRQEIAQRATSYRTQMTDWDVEATSTFFAPDMRMSAQGYR